jgi:hypothetical protein
MENLSRGDQQPAGPKKRAGSVTGQDVERHRIERFSQSVRSGVATLVNRSPRLADLIDTFPGLLFVLAGPCPVELRQEVCAMVDAGAALRTVARKLDVPFWLRRLAPEAFSEPLTPLPRTPAFERAVINHIPTSPWAQYVWLTHLTMAAALVGEEYAIWTAQYGAQRPSREKQVRWVWLTAYAWYSNHPETEAYRLIRRPFQRKLTLVRAHEEFDIWLNRVHLVIALGDHELHNWCKPGRSRGFDIVPLTTPAAFLSESAEMRNCLDRYGASLMLGKLRIFSMRQRGQPVADFELVPHECDPSVPQIRQLRAVGNARATPEQWQAALAWLGRQPIPTLPPGIACFAPRPLRDRQMTCRRLWSPFQAALTTPKQRKLVHDALTLARLHFTS